MPCLLLDKTQGQYQNVVLQTICIKYTVFPLDWEQCGRSVFFPSLWRSLDETHSCNNCSWAWGALSTHTGHLYPWIRLWLTEKKATALWLRGEEEEEECEMLVGSGRERERDRERRGKLARWIIAGIPWTHRVKPPPLIIPEEASPTGQVQ